MASWFLRPDCHIFHEPGIDGMIGYRQVWGSALVIGDPVCAPVDLPALTLAFQLFCRANRWHIVYAITTPQFCAFAQTQGWATLPVSYELLVTPQTYARTENCGRRLRQKVRRAQREGVSISEYTCTPWSATNVLLERQFEHVAAQWLRRRRGVQMYIAPVGLFAVRRLSRWFYAHRAGQPVGIIHLLHSQRLGGYAVVNNMIAPAAPAGTAEALLAETLATLAREGTTRASCGVMPHRRLGPSSGLPRRTTMAATALFNSTAWALNFSAKGAFWHKFAPTFAESRYLILDPPHLGPRQFAVFSRAFNFGWAFGSRCPSSNG